MSAERASTMVDASVVICTHNPRSDHLARVLDSLRKQTLPLHKWELLIVDNGSRVPLALTWDVSWHPAARHVLESELGLSWARKRGIRESSADLIIFVDDDNVLDETYLAEAIRIKQEWPSLGVWGSGCVRGEFEAEPPEGLRSWLPVEELTAPRWSNLASCELDALFASQKLTHAVPMGAGLCVRKEMAIAYSQFCDQSSIQITDRQGAALLCGGDIEISLVCCSRGLGIGMFPELRLIHLIPRHRVSADYLVRFAEGCCLSLSLLRYKWRHIMPQSPFSIRTMLSILKTILLYRGLERDIRFAWVRALVKAKRIIELDLEKNNRQIYGMAARVAVDPRPD
jgi:glycosyltransferase involved in cell wall biosynthesis